MATKKATTKKGKVVKHKKFDLSFDRPDQINDVVDALQALQQDRGWQLLKQIFEGNIAVLEGAILKKLDPEDGKTVLNEADCDRLRDKLAYLEEILEKPNAIIKKLTQEQPETPDYDPYDKLPVRRVGRKE